MNLCAISLGSAVPRVDFDVVVHSVFHSAVNLKLAGESMLLTLLASGETDLPQGIRLDTHNGFSFDGLPVGLPGMCRDGVLKLAASWTIILRDAATWDGCLPALRADLANPAVQAAWQIAWQVVNDRQAYINAELVADELWRHPTNGQSLLAREVGQALRDLLVMTRDYRLATKQAPAALIGLGTGLTPSGDDLLVGYLAGLWCATNGKRERLDFLSALGESVIRLSNRTNDISRTYLCHAARGHVSSRLDQLASAICAGLPPSQVRVRAESAMQAGHTSGMEAVTGLLFGLAAWDDGALTKA